MYHAKIIGTMQLTSNQKLLQTNIAVISKSWHIMYCLLVRLTPRRPYTRTNITKHWLNLFEGMSQDQSTFHSFIVVLYHTVKPFYETLFQHDVTTQYMDRSASWSRQC